MASIEALKVVEHLFGCRGGSEFAYFHGQSLRLRAARERDARMDCGFQVVFILGGCPKIMILSGTRMWE
jgi:hypothetical protein